MYHYICSKPHISGTPVKRNNISILYDEDVWQFLMNEDTAHCHQMRVQNSSILIQTLLIDKLTMPNKVKVAFKLYFDVKILCKNIEILKILASGCSNNNFYISCTLSKKSDKVGMKKVCSFDCPLRLVNNQVVVSLLSIPPFMEENSKLCEMEIFYPTS